ncbi:MAG: hypothetical protein QOK31_1716 [Solirubrobacteraceae bacterium]|jgi:hypothetical protein|nr:hypothetical protein [Solirubrobacteraceae bacterium]
MTPRKGDDPSGVLGGLPRTRPQRRSDRRGPAKPAVVTTAAKPPRPKTAKRPAHAATIRQPAQPRGVPPQPPRDAEDVAEAQAATQSPGTVETAIQAAGELAQIGITVGAQALRSALSRLPRP